MIDSLRSRLTAFSRRPIRAQFRSTISFAQSFGYWEGRGFAWEDGEVPRVNEACVRAASQTTPMSHCLHVRAPGNKSQTKPLNPINLMFLNSSELPLPAAQGCIVGTGHRLSPLMLTAAQSLDSPIYTKHFMSKRQAICIVSDKLLSPCSKHMSSGLLGLCLAARRQPSRPPLRPWHL